MTLKQIAYRFAVASMPCAALIATFSASAQITPANRPALLAKGYNQTDFKAAEKTQIGSNYPLYQKFAACLEQAGNVIVMNNVTDARAGLIVGQCQDDGLALRAAIARSLGLPQATRVVSMLGYDFGLQMKKRMQAQNNTTSDGTTRIGIWVISKFDQHSCVAAVNAPSYVDDLRFINNAGTVSLLIRTDFEQPANGEFTKDRVVIGHYPAPSVMDGQFRVVRLSGQTWLAAQMSVQDLHYIRLGGTLSIERHGSSRSEERGIGGSIDDVLNFVQRCSA